MILGYIVGFLLVVAVTLTIGALMLLWAWNVFMPSVFNLPMIDFWQALALSILLASIGRVQIGGKS